MPAQRGTFMSRPGGPPFAHTRTTPQGPGVPGPRFALLVFPLPGGSNASRWRAQDYPQTPHPGSQQFRVSNVVTAQSAARKENDMTIFTIDEQNNITAFASQEEATAASTTPFDSFGSEQQLAELVAGWPAARRVALWNSLPGVTPVKSFRSPKAAAARVWKRIQGLGDAAQPEPEAAPAKPKGGKKAAGRAQSAKGAPVKGKSAKKATPAKTAPKGKKTPKAQEAAGPREGSKTAQVVAMLQRAKGASISEIMDKMDWQRHTVRGFMAGAMKKAGFTVESFKPEGGESSYRLPK